jgi:hypothetical protein
MIIPSVESLFDEHKKDRNEAWFQILMYCSIYKKENSHDTVRPAIYTVRSMYGKDFEDSLRVKDSNGQAVLINDFERIKDSYEFQLCQTIEKIFNQNEPFTMTNNVKKCEYCPFIKLCQR